MAHVTGEEWITRTADEMLALLLDEGPDGCEAFRAHGTIYRVVERIPAHVVVRRDEDGQTFRSFDGLMWEFVS